MESINLTFSLTGSVTITQLCRELEKLGYGSGELQTYAQAVRYHDTQDGRLFGRGLRLQQPAEGNVWYLQDISTGDCREIEFGSEAESAELPAAVSELVRGMRLLPWLDLQSREKRTAIRSPGEGNFALSYRDIVFGDVLQRDRKQKLLLLGVRGSKSAAEVAYFGTILRDLLGFQLLAGDDLEIGLQALHRPLPGAPVPDKYQVNRRDTILKAGCKIIGRQGYIMWANTPGTAADLDPEFLHDLRVATRRARFALRLMGPFLGESRCEDLRRELSWVASLLGKVRDLDVFLHMLDHQFPQVNATAAVRERIEGYLKDKRKDVSGALETALVSARYTELLERMELIYREKDRPTGDGEAGVSAHSIAPDFIEKALAKIEKKQARDAWDFSAVQLHRLRIRFKQLRYTCEFFSDFYGQRMRKVIQSFVRFQDCLGVHQDAQVAIHNLQELAHGMEVSGRADADVLLCIGALVQIQRDLAQTKVQEFTAIWSKFPRSVKKLRHLLVEG
ncbi:MAG: CHAD domain-containing protein [Acidobacteria bacterium]|nr:CHAD domain-containing protein [Acidobacteriota bacterium]